MDSNLNVSAFKNTNGTTTVVVLNGNSSATALSVTLQNLSAASSAVPYLTNGSNNIAAQPSIPISGGAFNAMVPARSLVTYVLGAGGPPSTNTPTNTTQPSFQPPTNTFTPTHILTSTNTLTPTNTLMATNSRTPTNTPTAGNATLQVQIQSGGADNTQQSQFNFLIKNMGGTAQSNISVRIYIQLDGSQPISKYAIEKYWDQSGVATVSGPTLAASGGSNYYWMISFGTTSLGVGASWQYNTALHLSDWTNNFSAGNDFFHTGYPVGSLPSSFTSTNYIPAYVSVSQIWGTTTP